MIGRELVSLGPNKVSKGTRIRNRYNQVPHLTQDTISNTKTSQFTICAEVRFGPACSKIPIFMPMGWPSGSLFNPT